jgi:hypothetical protein
MCSADSRPSSATEADDLHVAHGGVLVEELGVGLVDALVDADHGVAHPQGPVSGARPGVVGPLP